MGCMRHHAIVVTSYKAELIEGAHVVAARLFPWVSPISPQTTNGHRSFFVPPDGSKEGWNESIVGDRARDALVEWLHAQRYDDGSTSLDWVEVQYGDDDGKTFVVRDNDHPAAIARATPTPEEES